MLVYFDMERGKYAVRIKNEGSRLFYCYKPAFEH